MKIKEKNMVKVLLGFFRVLLGWGVGGQQERGWFVWVWFFYRKETLCQIALILLFYTFLLYRKSVELRWTLNIWHHTSKKCLYEGSEVETVVHFAVPNS